LDKFFGGIGLRRGRTHPTELNNIDSLDFWRVIYANKDAKKLLLYAEMKLPGEAWLEFKIMRCTKQLHLDLKESPEDYIGTQLHHFIGLFLMV